MLSFFLVMFRLGLWLKTRFIAISMVSWSWILVKILVTIIMIYAIIMTYIIMTYIKPGQLLWFKPRQLTSYRNFFASFFKFSQSIYTSFSLLYINKLYKFLDSFTFWSIIKWQSFSKNSEMATSALNFQ